MSSSYFDRRVIQSNANTTNFRQGEALYFRNGITVIQNKLRAAGLDVIDSRKTYTVSFALQEDNLTAQCTCELDTLFDGESGLSQGWCRHIVAAALEMHNVLIYHPHITWDSKLNRMIGKKAKKSTVSSSHKSLLVFSLEHNVGSYSIDAFQISTTGWEQTQIDDFLNGKTDQKRLAALGESAKRVRGAAAESQFLNADSLSLAAATSCSILQHSTLYGKERAAAMASILSYLGNATVYQGYYSNNFHSYVKVLSEPAQARLSLEENNGDYSLTWQFLAGDKVIELEKNNSNVILDSPLWVLGSGIVVRVDTGLAPASEILQYPVIQIPKEDASEFLDNYLAPLAEKTPISGEALSWDTVDTTPTARLYLSQQENEVQVVLRFGYGDFELPYANSAAPIGICRRRGEAALSRVVRDLEFETSRFNILAETPQLRRGKTADTFLLRAKSHPVEFLITCVPQFASEGFEVFGEELIKERVNRSRPNISFSVGSGIDWFDVKVNIDFGGVAAKLKDVRLAIRHKQRYVKLADGSMGELPEDWLEKYRKLFVFADVDDETLKMRKSQAVLLDAILSESESARFDQGFEESLSRLRSFQRVEQEQLPVGLNAELRPYQKAGYDWLHFLRKYEFGGCLADDMGLGKTVQALALLLWMREHEEARKPALVVVPRSLILNWMRESHRFTPALTLLANAGIDRIKNPKHFAKYDVVLMTYGTMLRDIAHLSKHRFSYVILDEAQVIKNPVSLVSRAARTLNADHKLALTGTPMENSTLDIWSLFDFLNPGLLGSIAQFKSEFAAEIEHGDGNAAASFLRKMVFPFIMRRTKSQVAPELPSRTERIVTAEMDPEQKAIYDKYRDHYRNMLLGIIDESGMQNARMKILEGLLRLRQIANHPVLVDHDTTAPSAKMESLIETLATLHAEGHKALVFSQFVQMLRLIRTELDKRGLKYEWLTGQTQKRQEVVDHFQNDPDVPFFLLSLKAGGVGLNLTAADYVLHVDPWWNPAVEMQATDRTHRIGQDKPVIVYKFVVSGTVEEKILQLQDQKRNLTSSVISSETGFFKTLGRDDIAVLFE